MPASDKYTDPKLREEVKEELKESDKGGAPGQWSARKAQLMAQEYKKRGGDYTTDKSDKDESQKNLSRWGDEEWQTKDGSAQAKKDDGTRKRYLPKKAWEKMSEDDKKDTENKKQQGSKQGKQFVANSDKAKKSREEAQDEVREGADDESDEQQQSGDEDEDNDAEDEAKKRQQQGAKKGAAANKKKAQGKQAEQKAPPKRQSTRKRSQSASASASEDGGEGDSGKKQKTNSGKAATKNGSGGKNADGTYGSKHDRASPPENTTQASKDSLPSKGQKVHWKAMPGWCTGTVQEILTSDKVVDGRKRKASEDDPAIVMRSDGPSKKLAVHKADKVYFVAAH